MGIPPILLDSTRLLFDLQHINGIAQDISGCLVPEQIADRVTVALVDQFDCVFARIWLMEPDQTQLRLVASSGLYTHTNGSFARVALGAYKVGKIAQNRVPFLSNRLAEESWVKDRDWAIANQIQGFAGYPLLIQDRVLGVLAAFSQQRLAPEFLEVLQVLCMITTIALESALQASQSSRARSASGPPSLLLSDQLAMVLPATQFLLVGTEQPLPPACHYVFLQMAETLNRAGCSYCRLTYDASGITLEAILSDRLVQPEETEADLAARFSQLQLVAVCLGGRLEIQSEQPRVTQVSLALPYPSLANGHRIYLSCNLPVLRLGMVNLIHQAGLELASRPDSADLILTNDPDQVQIAPPTIWIRSHPQSPIPCDVAAVVDLTTTPAYLQQMVDQILAGIPLVREHGCTAPILSQREREVISLLAQGWRDRDIAKQLFISESTVKFHLNNSLAKLNAKNRYQAVYQAAIQGCI